MITTSEISVSLTIDDTSRLSRIIDDLKHYGTVETDNEQTIISAVGEGISDDSEAARLVFTALAGIPVRMISYGGSRHNISILIPSSFKSRALNALSSTLFNH
jgi:aspartate kinase